MLVLCWKFLGKSTKIVANKAVLFGSNMDQTVRWLGHYTRPTHWGSSKRPQASYDDTMPGRRKEGRGELIADELKIYAVTCIQTPQIRAISAHASARGLSWLRQRCWKLPACRSRRPTAAVARNVDALPYTVERQISTPRIQQRSGTRWSSCEQSRRGTRRSRTTPRTKTFRLWMPAQFCCLAASKEAATAAPCSRFTEQFSAEKTELLGKKEHALGVSHFRHTSPPTKTHLQNHATRLVIRRAAKIYEITRQLTHTQVKLKIGVRFRPPALIAGTTKVPA